VTGSTFGGFPTVNAVQSTFGGVHGANAFITKINATGSALVYSTYLGGSVGDIGCGIAADSSGNAYVTGYTESTNFPTVNAIQSSLAGSANAFITKINATGSALVYSTYLGGSGSDFGYGIAADSSGNAYVTGTTSSTNFPTANAIQSNLDGPSDDVFITKMNATGSSLAYSTYVGGRGADVGKGIAVDSSGNAYVTGYTESTDFPTVNAIQSSLAGSANAFITKINATGSALVHSTYLGGGGSDIGYGIAVDSSGNAYVTGTTNSTNFPTANAIQSSLAGPTNAFIAKINASGATLVYSTYLGGSGYPGDSSASIGVDSSGSAYVTGTTNSTDFPTVNAIQATFRGPGSDAFVAEINASGSVLLYSTYFGDNNTGGTGIAVDSSGDAYVTGNTSGNIPLVNAFQSSFSLPANSSAFVAEILSAVNISPSTLAFVNQPIGTASAPQALMLQNNSNSALTISNLAFNGSNGSEFSETDNCVGSLPTGASCSINVTFTPVATGSQTGSLIIANSLTTSPLTIPLTGTGVAVARNAILSVNSLTFASQTIGVASAPLAVTLSNTGNEPLVISNLAASGTNGTIATEFAETNNCGGSVSVGANCTINVTFTPTAAGIRTGALTITDNATNPPSPQTVSLSGTGTSPPSFSFAAGSSGTSTAVTAGQTATYSLTVGSSGGFSGAVAMSCTGTPANASCSVSPNPATLSGTSPVVLTVNVNTTARSGVAPLGLRVPGMPVPVEEFALAIFLSFCLWMVPSGLAGRRPAHVALAALFLLLGLLTGCGGGSSSTSVTSNGTPAGTYTLTVTGTSSSVVQAIQLTLTVN
jgi:hypothetical protein